MTDELKELPEGGTRKSYKDLMVAFVLTLVAIIMVAIFMGKFDAVDGDGVMMISPRFTMVMELLGWASMMLGSLFGIYSLSENAKKHSFAVLNRHE